MKTKPHIFLISFTFLFLFSDSFAAKIDDMICSKNFPKKKNMITLKGFYIGMNICDAEKLMREGKHKRHFQNISYKKFDEFKKIYLRSSEKPTGKPGWEKTVNTVIQSTLGGKVISIQFYDATLHGLFKNQELPLSIFAESIAKRYIKGDPSYKLEPFIDKYEDFGYMYYNGEVGYNLTIKRFHPERSENFGLLIEEVSKLSEGF